MIDTNNPKAMPAMVFRQPGHTGYELDLSGANTGVLPYGVYLPWDKLFAHLSPATKWTASGKPTQYGDPIGISGQSWRVTNGKKAYFASPQNESTVLHVLDGAMDELDEARRKGFLSDSDLQSGQPKKVIDNRQALMKNIQDEVGTVEDEAPDAGDLKDRYPGRGKAADLLSQSYEESLAHADERIARESENPMPGWGSGSRGFDKKLKQLNRELFKRSQERDRQLEAEKQASGDESTS